jgi:hypothetical protein
MLDDERKKYIKGLKDELNSNKELIEKQAHDIAKAAEELAVLGAVAQDLQGPHPSLTKKKKPQRCSICGEIGHNKKYHAGGAND